MKIYPILLSCFLLISCHQPESELYFKQGLVEFNHHKFQSAKIYFADAIASAPDSAKYYLYKALTEEPHMLQPDEAQRDLDKAIYLNPRYERAYMERALLARFEDGKYEQRGAAVKYLNKVIELNPKMIRFTNGVIVSKKKEKP